MTNLYVRGPLEPFPRGPGDGAEHVDYRLDKALPNPCALAATRAPELASRGGKELGTYISRTGDLDPPTGILHGARARRRAAARGVGPTRRASRGLPRGRRSAPCCRTSTCTTRSTCGSSNGGSGTREVKSKTPSTCGSAPRPERARTRSGRLALPAQAETDGGGSAHLSIAWPSRCSARSSCGHRISASTADLFALVLKMLTMSTADCCMCIRFQLAAQTMLDQKESGGIYNTRNFGISSARGHGSQIVIFRIDNFTVELRLPWIDRTSCFSARRPALRRCARRRAGRRRRSVIPRGSAARGRRGRDLLPGAPSFAAARVLGGPIFWRLGWRGLHGDRSYHDQVEIGVVVSLPSNIETFAEGAQPRSRGNSRVVWVLMLFSGREPRSVSRYEEKLPTPGAQARCNRAVDRRGRRRGARGGRKGRAREGSHGCC
jgi:hypothetical protein